MKQLKFILLLSFCIFLLNHTAARDVISYSRTYNSYGLSNIGTNPEKITSVPTATASKIKIENGTYRHDFTPSFELAAKILAEAIKDDFPLTIEISFGNSSEFDSDWGTGDHLAITTSRFVLNNYENRNPDTTNPIRNTEGLDMLIPQSIANREYAADTDPSSPDMTIKLNPNVDFYYGEDANGIAETQYDLVTVILREMVTGCGFASSLSKSGSTLNYLGNVNGQNYPYLFDSKIFNSNGTQFSSINNSTSGIISFLDGNNIYFGNSTYGHQLYNDLLFSPGEGVSALTKNTLNRSIDFNSTPENIDLMTNFFYSGMVIRKMTPITKSILEEMGWDIDIITGGTYRYNIINMNNTGFTLSPNTNYTLKTDIPSYADCNQQSFTLNLVKSDGEYFLLKQDEYGLGLLTLNYSSLPSYDWQRDPETGFIIGYVSFSGKSSGTNPVYYTAYKRVLLPYSPSTVAISAAKANTTTTSMEAKVNHLAQGATSYRLNYSAYGETSQYYVDVDKKENVSTVLSNLNPNKKYSIYVTAYNSNGSTNSETVTVGDDIVSQVSMILTKTGTTLKYQFKLGSEYLNNLIINSAAIYDVNGNYRMSVSAGINQYFSISSLSSGIYILKVDVANYKTYSKSFMK